MDGHRPKLPANRNCYGSRASHEHYLRLLVFLFLCIPKLVLVSLKAVFNYFSAIFLTTDHMLCGCQTGGVGSSGGREWGLES